MPARIPLSHVKALGFDFAEAVANYRNALADWTARPADWDPCPPPGAPHPLVTVAASVDSYELVDDTPPPPAPPPLEERKNRLAAEVHQAAEAAIAAVIHPLRRPLIELRIKQAAETKWENRTLGDREALNNQKGLEARVAAIRLHAAEQMAAIADLTEETIDGWKMAPFPEAAPDVALPLEERKQQLADDVDAELTRRLQRAQPALKQELVAIKLRTIGEKQQAKGPLDADEVKFLQEANAIGEYVKAQRLHAAELKHAIADLTEATIASWSPRAFPA